MLGFQESGVCLRWFMRSSLVEIKPSTLNLQTSSFWRFSQFLPWQKLTKHGGGGGAGWGYQRLQSHTSTLKRAKESLQHPASAT